MCNLTHSLYREYRIKEVDINGKLEYNIEYYYSPFPITNDYKLNVKIWIHFFRTEHKHIAEELCNLYQIMANRHLIKS